MKRKISIVLLLCFTASLFSQEVVLEIEPYTQDNIPSWARDVRRTSIITLGSVPFTTLATTFGYSLYRYIANDFNSDYIPNLFGSSSASKLDYDEQIGIIIVATSLSFLIGLTDLIVIKVRESKKVRQLEEEQNEIIVTQSED